MIPLSSPSGVPATAATGNLAPGTPWGGWVEERRHRDWPIQCTQTAACRWSRPVLRLSPQTGGPGEELTSPGYRPMATPPGAEGHMRLRVAPVFKWTVDCLAKPHIGTRKTHHRSRVLTFFET